MKNFKELPKREINGGVQYLFKAKNNNYGASIVKHSFSYGNKQGLWELAVIEWDKEDFELTYETEITNDVLGYLSDNDVMEILEKIESLPNKS